MCLFCLGFFFFFVRILFLNRRQLEQQRPGTRPANVRDTFGTLVPKTGRERTEFTRRRWAENGVEPADEPSLRGRAYLYESSRRRFGNAIKKTSVCLGACLRFPPSSGLGSGVRAHSDVLVEKEKLSFIYEIVVLYCNKEFYLCTIGVIWERQEGTLAPSKFCT